MPLVWFPVIALLFVLAGLPTSTFLLYLVAGPLWWSLLEYGLHRFVFHMPLGSFTQNYVHMMLHGYHHLVPMDPLRLTFPPVPAAIIGFLLYLPSSAVLGHQHALAYMAGLVLGYIGYDCTHYWLHHASARTTFGGLKRNHLYHHFKDSQRNFGITSPVLDWVFRTYEWA